MTCPRQGQGDTGKLRGEDQDELVSLWPGEEMDRVLLG